MVKHIILWTLKQEYSEEEKAEIRKGIKKLETLDGKIPGMTAIKVNIDPLATSNADAMLDSTFVDVDALAGYAKHPEHVAIADQYIRPFYETRSCLDFEE